MVEDNLTDEQVWILWWWNLRSTLEQRQTLCKVLGWPEDNAGGEDSLEWLYLTELEELLAVPIEKITEIIQT